MASLAQNVEGIDAASRPRLRLRSPLVSECVDSSPEVVDGDHRRATHPRRNRFRLTPGGPRVSHALFSPSPVKCRPKSSRPDQTELITPHLLSRAGRLLFPLRPMIESCGFDRPRTCVDPPAADIRLRLCLRASPAAGASPRRTYRPASQTAGRACIVALSQRRPTASSPADVWTTPANSLLMSLNAG